MSEMTITLNGTASNLYNQFGLYENPFPITGNYKIDSLLKKLESGPILDTSMLGEMIRESGACSEEFEELCFELFRPGCIVKFKINWLDEE